MSQNDSKSKEDVRDLLIGDKEKTRALDQDELRNISGGTRERAKKQA